MWTELMISTGSIHSLPPERVISQVYFSNSSSEIGVSWVPLNPIDDKSTLVQVMAWCRQAPSHYWNQCWSRSVSPNGINRPNELTHWGRVTHICVGKPTTIGSDNGLSPGWRQAIIWTNAGILLIGPLGIKFSEILSEIITFSFNKMHLKMSLPNGVYFVSASMS